MSFQVNTVAYSYNYDKERIDSPPPQTRIEIELGVCFQVLTALTKEFKKIKTI